jgi:type VI protein secretion system component VasK
MKYPFTAEASEDATFEEFEDFFRPGTGMLSQEIASGGAKGSSRAGLLKLGESIQKSLYPPGATTPQFHFSVTATVPQGLKSGKLNLDGFELPLVESSPKTQIFEWPGQKREAELQVGGSKYYGPFAGPWAVFRLLGSYNWSATRGGYHLESPPLNPPGGGVPFKDSLDVRTEGVPLFRRGYLAQLRCAASAQRL